MHANLNPQLDAVQLWITRGRSPTTQNFLASMSKLQRKPPHWPQYKYYSSDQNVRGSLHVFALYIYILSLNEGHAGRNRLLSWWLGVDNISRQPSGEWASIFLFQQFSRPQLDQLGGHAAGKQSVLWGGKFWYFYCDFFFTGNAGLGAWFLYSFLYYFVFGVYILFNSELPISWIKNISWFVKCFLISRIWTDSSGWVEAVWAQQHQTVGLFEVSLRCQRLFPSLRRVARSWETKAHAEPRASWTAFSLQLMSCGNYTPKN